MAEILDIYIDQGASFMLPKILLSPLGLPVDLTGFSGRGAIRAKAQDVAPVAELTVTIADALTGRYNVELDAAASALIPLTGSDYSRPGVFCYDVELFETAGTKVVRVLNGKAYISPEVTK